MDDDVKLKLNKSQKMSKSLIFLESFVPKHLMRMSNDEILQTFYTLFAMFLEFRIHLSYTLKTMFYTFEFALFAST